MIKNNSELCCPEFVPPGACDDFCIPEDCCPLRLETPKFPSPTSCLPEEQTEELERQIDATNELLLNFALSNEQPELGKMKSLEGLIEQLVEIELDCEETEVCKPTKKTTQIEAKESVVKRKRKIWKWRRQVGKIQKRNYKIKKPRVGKRANLKKVSKRKQEKAVNQEKVIVRDNIKICGVVCFVGRDFVVLRESNEQIIIPLSKIISLKTDSRILQPLNKPELLNIDPCLRRSLTFNFGETVSCSPELIDIFFKTTLAIFLLNRLHKNMKIKIEDEEIEGTLVEVTSESMRISLCNEKEMDIPFLSVCFITI